MEIESFPGPKTGSRIGFGTVAAEVESSHGRGEERVLRGEDRARRWAQTGIGWVTLKASLERPVPSGLIAALTRHGIEPVLGLDRSPVSGIDQRALRTVLAAYSEAGGRYAYVYTSPNLARAWESAEWSEAGLVKRFVGLLQPSLARTVEAGLIPLLPPLQPGGDYWDTAFLAETLEILMAEDRDLVDSMGVATVTPLDRDLNWGRGGATRWPKARPFHTPPGSQDHRGFQIFAWYDEIIRERVGRSLPQVAVACYPAAGGPIQRAAEAAALAKAGSLPPYLLCVNLGPLEAEDGTPAPTIRMLADRDEAPSDESAAPSEPEVPEEPGPPPEAPISRPEALVPPPEAPAPEAGPLPQTPTTELDARQLPPLGSEPSGESPSSNGELQHYVLFPTWDFGVSDWYWRMATEYVRAFQPACGFRPDEAGLARYVTIIGDEGGVTAATEQELAARGCRVERIAGEDAESTRKILESMVKQGRRFLTWEETPWS